MAYVSMTNTFFNIANSSVSNTVVLTTQANNVVSSQIVMVVANSSFGGQATITVANVNGNVSFGLWNPPIPGCPPQIIFKNPADTISCTPNNAATAYPAIFVLTPG